jgi:E3 ubiquitin-protein ligase HUWE1
MAVYITPEESSQSSIFLYETSLVNQLASLMVPGRGVGDAVLSAAVYAIDACAHHRNKLLEVSAAIGTNVSHGVLISLLRDTLHRLTGGGEPDKAEHVMFEVVDSLLTMVAFVATSPPHSNQIIGAGIIPVILEFPKTRSDKRDNVSFLTQVIHSRVELTRSTLPECLDWSMPSSSARLRA